MGLPFTGSDHAQKLKRKPGSGSTVKIRDFQKLLAYICENGFEHHVAVNPTRIAAGVKEALTKYLDWDVYHHS